MISDGNFDIQKGMESTRTVIHINLIFSLI